MKLLIANFGEQTIGCSRYFVIKFNNKICKYLDVHDLTRIDGVSCVDTVIKCKHEDFVCDFHSDFVCGNSYVYDNRVHNVICKICKGNEEKALKLLKEYIRRNFLIVTDYKAQYEDYILILSNRISMAFKDTMNELDVEKKYNCKIKLK